MRSQENKATSICFGWMREGHYPKFLYRDIELTDVERKPSVFVEEEKYPELWNLMNVLEQSDLKIKGVKSIVLSLVFESIEDKFLIRFICSEGEKKNAGYISIFNLSSEEVTELVKSKIGYVS